MEQLLLEKPFTDPEERYTVTNSKETYCFKVHNLESGGTYIVNPFIGTCTCPDFHYRTNGGGCKHIEFLQQDKRIKPLIEQYEANHQSRASQTRTPISPTIGEHDGEGEQSPFAIMERKDEDQIIAEMKGNVLEEFVYSFPQGNRQVTGLSYAGVKQIALERGNIHCEEPILQENGSSWICKVKATDVQRNLEMWGVATQQKMMKLSNGGEIVDTFCVQKCVSKAERNALRKLMPEKIIVEMIKEWQKGRKKPNG